MSRAASSSSRVLLWDADISRWSPAAAEWTKAMRRVQPEERSRIRQFR